LVVVVQTLLEVAMQAALVQEHRGQTETLEQGWLGKEIVALSVEEQSETPPVPRVAAVALAERAVNLQTLTVMALAAQVLHLLLLTLP